MAQMDPFCLAYFPPLLMVCFSDQDFCGFMFDLFLPFRSFIMLNVFWDFRYFLTMKSNNFFGIVFRQYSKIPNTIFMVVSGCHPIRIFWCVIQLLGLLWFANLFL